MATSTLGSGTLVLAGTTSGTTTVTATAVAGTTTLTLPAATDTLVGRATTDTLTNKTLTGAVMNGTLGATTPSTVAATTISASSTATFAAGAAGTPSITTTGDTNTGIFFPAADTIAFAEGGVEAMRIDSDGDVGIGTVSPGAKLEVIPVADSFFTGGLRVSRYSGGNLQYGTMTNNGGLALTVVEAAIGAPVISFHRSSDGTTTTESARIDSSGNLLVGTTSAISSLTERLAVKVASGNLTPISTSVPSNANRYQMEFYTPSGLAGYILTNTLTTTYASSSDYRLKNNITPMTGALAKVALLKPVTYKWNIDGSDGQGFIAHELDEVVPDCVTGAKDAVDKDGKPQYQGVDTSFLVATLTAAIQEQQALITQLTARITALESA
jgi:hypothetical protein